MVFDSHHKEELIQKCLGKLSFALKILEFSSYKNYSNDNDHVMMIIMITIFKIIMITIKSLLLPTECIVDGNFSSGE